MKKKTLSLLLALVIVFGFLPAAAEETVSRAEFVMNLGQFFAIRPSLYQEMPFDDVSMEKGYAPYVSWARQNRIVQGSGNNLFSPESPITREEAAVMLLRTYQYAKQGPQGAWMIHLDYSDLESVSPWAGEAVAFCTLKQVIPPVGSAFCPQSPITEEEAKNIIGSFSAQIASGLYAAAVEDAKTIEPEEILPVVSVAENSPDVTWNEEGKVLMLSMHKYPDSYPEGTSVILKWGEVWTFTDKEIKAWYRANKEGVSNWPLRFKQLIGLPLDSSYTHVSGFWVSPENLIRPAYEPDISKSVMTDHFAIQPSPAFLSWFEGNMKWSYEESAYPWTRLGYTYDWAYNGKEYGLSEFLIQKDAQVDVAFTYTIDAFLDWLNQ